MSFLDRLRHDPVAGTHHDGSMRYMFIKPEALMGVVHEMPAADRPALLEAMSRSVIRQGGASARAYRAAGADDAAGLLATIRDTAGQLGWGRWTFELGNDLRLRVDGSPFAAGYGPAPWPICAPIRGMLTAVASMIFDRPVNVSENACAACGSPACRFTAIPEGHPE